MRALCKKSLSADNGVECFTQGKTYIILNDCASSLYLEMYDNDGDFDRIGEGWQSFFNILPENIDSQYEIY